jgi:hypothetical protein
VNVGLRFERLRRRKSDRRRSKGRRQRGSATKLIGVADVFSMMTAAPPPIVAFANLPRGWVSYQGEDGAYALSWRYHPNSLGWATKMPRGGIAIQVFFPNDRAHYPPLRRGLPKRPSTTLEGAPETPEYRIHGRVLGRDVEVWVDIRRAHPTISELRLAQRVISGPRFRT